MLNRLIMTFAIIGVLLLAGCERRGTGAAKPAEVSLNGLDQAGVEAVLGKPDSIKTWTTSGPKNPMPLMGPVPTVLKEDCLYVNMWYANYHGEVWAVFLAADSSLKTASTQATQPATGPAENAEPMHVVEVQKYQVGVVF